MTKDKEVSQTAKTVNTGLYGADVRSCRRVTCMGYEWPWPKITSRSLGIITRKVNRHFKIRHIRAMGNNTPTVEFLGAQGQ